MFNFLKSKKKTPPIELNKKEIEKGIVIINL